MIAIFKKKIWQIMYIMYMYRVREAYFFMVLQM